jgi:hypothetical protein
LEDSDVDERIILKRTFEKWDVRHGLDRSGSGQGQVAGSCECCNKPFASIKCRKFLSTSGPVSFLERTLIHGENINEEVSREV